MYTIYKIVGENTNKCYIGSTKNLKNRIACHKCKNNCKSSEIMNNEPYTLTIIETINNIDDKKVIYDRESYYIENTENCINRNLPNGSNRTHILCKCCGMLITYKNYSRHTRSIYCIKT